MKLKELKTQFTQLTNLKAIASNGRKYLKVKKDFRKKDTWQLVTDIVKQLELTPILLSEFSEFFTAMNAELPDIVRDDFLITFGDLLDLDKLEDAVNYEYYQNINVIDKLERLKREVTEKCGEYYNSLKEYCHQHIDKAAIEKNDFGNSVVWHKYCMFIQYTGLYVNDLDINAATGKKVYLSKVDEWDYIENLSLFVSVHPSVCSIKQALDTAWEFYQCNKGYANRDVLASFLSKKEGKGWKYISHKCFRCSVPNDSEFNYYGINGSDKNPWSGTTKWIARAEAEVEDLDKVAEVLIYCFGHNEAFVTSAIEKYRTSEAFVKAQNSIEVAFKKCSTLQELKQERNKLAAIHHPDKGGSNELMQMINNLFEKYKSILNVGFSDTAMKDLIEEMMKRQSVRK